MGPFRLCYIHDFCTLYLRQSLLLVNGVCGQEIKHIPILQILCPGLKIVTPNFKCAYLSLSNKHAHICQFVGTVLRAFFQMPWRAWNILQDFRSNTLQTWNRVSFTIPRLIVRRFTKFGFSNTLYSGRSIRSCLSLYSVCAIWGQPHCMRGTVS